MTATWEVPTWPLPTRPWPGALARGPWPEALARAQALAGDAGGARPLVSQAREAAMQVSEADDRAVVLADLGTLALSPG